MSKIREEITCDIGNFKFMQGFVKVMNTFIRRCAISPIYMDFDITPVILYIYEQQGSYDRGGMFII